MLLLLVIIMDIISVRILTAAISAIMGITGSGMISPGTTDGGKGRTGQCDSNVELNVTLIASRWQDQRRPSGAPNK